MWLRKPLFRKLLRTDYLWLIRRSCWDGEDMSAAQIIAQLQAAVRKLEEAQRQVGAARQAASEARQFVASALEGSSGQLVGQIERLIQALSQAGQLPAATKEQVEATIRKTQALGN